MSATRRLDGCSETPKAIATARLDVDLRPRSGSIEQIAQALFTASPSSYRCRGFRLDEPVRSQNPGRSCSNAFRQGYPVVLIRNQTDVPLVDWFTPHSLESRSTIYSPRPCKSVPDGRDILGSPNPRSMTDTRMASRSA